MNKLKSWHCHLEILTENCKNAFGEEVFLSFKLPSSDCPVCSLNSGFLK